jgi:hypothetical protein
LHAFSTLVKNQTAQQHSGAYLQPQYSGGQAENVESEASLAYTMKSCLRKKNKTKEKKKENKNQTALSV